MNSLRFELSNFKRIHHLKSMLNKERVAFSSDYNCVIILALSKESGGEEIAGFVGFQKIGNAIRYKTDYVLPRYRKKGVYSQLWEEREALVEALYGRALKQTAFCTEYSIYMYTKEGFKKRSVRNGITFVERNLK